MLNTAHVPSLRGCRLPKGGRWAALARWRPTIKSVCRHRFVLSRNKIATTGSDLSELRSEFAQYRFEPSELYSEGRQLGGGRNV